MICDILYLSASTNFCQGMNSDAEWYQHAMPYDDCWANIPRGTEPSTPSVTLLSGSEFFLSYFLTHEDLPYARSMVPKIATPYGEWSLEFKQRFIPAYYKEPLVFPGDFNNPWKWRDVLYQGVYTVPTEEDTGFELAIPRNPAPVMQVPIGSLPVQPAMVPVQVTNIVVPTIPVPALHVQTPGMETVQVEGAETDDLLINRHEPRDVTGNDSVLGGDTDQRNTGILSRTPVTFSNAAMAANERRVPDPVVHGPLPQNVIPRMGPMVIGTPTIVKLYDSIEFKVVPTTEFTTSVIMRLQQDPNWVWQDFISVVNDYDQHMVDNLTLNTYPDAAN